MPIEATPIDAMTANLAILRHCRQKRAELAEMEQNARAAIETALGESEAGTIGGKVVVTWKKIQRSSIDQKLLRNRFPDVAEQCLTVTESRRFEFTQEDA